MVDRGPQLHGVCQTPRLSQGAWARTADGRCGQAVAPEAMEAESL